MLLQKGIPRCSSCRPDIDQKTTHLVRVVRTMTLTCNPHLQRVSSLTMVLLNRQSRHNQREEAALERFAEVQIVNAIANCNLIQRQCYYLPLYQLLVKLNHHPLAPSYSSLASTVRLHVALRYYLPPTTCHRPHSTLLSSLNRNRDRDRETLLVRLKSWGVGKRDSWVTLRAVIKVVLVLSHVPFDTVRISLFIISQISTNVQWLQLMTAMGDDS